MKHHRQIVSDSSSAKLECGVPQGTLLDLDFRCNTTTPTENLRLIVDIFTRVITCVPRVGTLHTTHGTSC